MEFIEIKEGLSIRLSKIESIQRDDNGGSIIIMESCTTYKTPFQFIQLLQMVELKLNINDEPKKEFSLERQFFSG